MSVERMAKSRILEACTPQDVAKRLKRLREEKGLKHSDLAARLGGDPTTYRYWEEPQPNKSGKRKYREGGCCQVAAAALLLGATPDELLLKDAVHERAAGLPPEDAEDLKRIWDELERLHELCDGASTSPFRIFADHLTQLRQLFEQPGAPKRAAARSRSRRDVATELQRLQARATKLGVDLAHEKDVKAGVRGFHGLARDLARLVEAQSAATTPRAGRPRKGSGAPNA